MEDGLFPYGLSGYEAKCSQRKFIQEEEQEDRVGIRVAVNIHQYNSPLYRDYPREFEAREGVHLPWKGCGYCM